MRPLFVFVIVAAFNVSAVRANPDGAPWGSADPNAAQNCASCHYDGEPILDSAAIKFEGVPDRYTLGSAYFVAVIFARTDIGHSGLLVTASGGEFSAGGGFLVENGNEIRSIRPKKAEGDTKWHMLWHAPMAPIGSVTFYIAVNAGNDDQSSFGDVIHFKTVTVSVE